MKAKERLRKDIEDGKYCLGEAIVPKEYKKMVIKNSQFTEEIFTIDGRKIPLMEIRKKLLQNEVKYMRDPPDFDNLESTELMKIFQDVIGKPVESVSEAKKELQLLSHTRHPQVWHDNSTIANNGYFMVTINTCYDENIHYTREEYKEKTGIDINVQADIEKPHIHILTKTSSSIEDQLLHSSTRLECIKGLDTELEISNGHKFIDKLRFFHGDDPSAQLETGKQKGGNYFCPICPIKATQTYSLRTLFSAEVERLEMKRKKVLDGPIASANIKHGKFPFSNFAKGDLVTELRGRGLIEESHKSKQIMEYALRQEICGAKLVPGLLYGHEFKEIRNILQDYEILPVEPCLDIPGHIKNVYTELPHHLNQNEKEILEHAINTSFAKKDTKRSVDYRKSIISVTTYCRGKIFSFAQLLLETLVNIQMLLYAGENKRNQKHIFRLNNLNLLHFLLCKIVTGKNLKVLSFRKFFGSYLHALIPHAGLQIRIVSGMTAFDESEERLFQQAKSITKQASNNQPGNIISNIILRSQVEEELKAHV